MTSREAFEAMCAREGIPRSLKEAYYVIWQEAAVWSRAQALEEAASMVDRTYSTHDGEIYVRSGGRVEEDDPTIYDAMSALKAGK